MLYQILAPEKHLLYQQWYLRSYMIIPTIYEPLLIYLFFL